MVERSQGTSNRWCEPRTCATAEELQARLDRMDRLHREVYPYRERLSRMAYFPGLAHSGRPYDRDSEEALWEWSRVAEHLSTYVLVRRVDRSGLVSLYNRGRYVGKIHQGKDVYVMYDPELNEWFFTDLEGRQLRRQPAEELSQERVMDLDVTHRRSDLCAQVALKLGVGIKRSNLMSGDTDETPARGLRRGLADETPATRGSVGHFGP